MYRYVCENCGAIREARYKSHVKRFCSHKCANEFRWKNTPKKRTRLICQNCGTAFDVVCGDARLKTGSVKYCSKKCSGEAHKTGSVIRCEQCGKEFYSTRHRFCSPECVYQFRSENSPQKLYRENGYVVMHIRGYNKKGNAKQHRVVMEEYLGRKLSDDEVVHHINGDKTDNRIENLQVMTRSAHSLLHRMKDRLKE